MLAGSPNNITAVKSGGGVLRGGGLLSADDLFDPRHVGTHARVHIDDAVLTGLAVHRRGTDPGEIERVVLL